MSSTVEPIALPRTIDWEELARGWPALLAGLAGNVIFSLPPYTAGIFLPALQASFGWTRTQVSLGVTIFTLGMALGAIGVGFLAQRVSSRILIGVGGLGYAAGFLAFACMGPSLPMFWTIGGLMTLVGAGCSPLTFSWVLIGVFDRHRGAALGLTLVGSGLASGIAPLVLVPMIAQTGWRGAYLGLSVGVGAALLLILGLLAMQRTAAPASALPAQTPTAAQPRWVFPVLLLASICVSLAVGGAVVHLAPMLADAHMPATHVAGLASVLGAALIASRLLSGLALDHFPASKVAAAVMLASALAFAVVAIGGRPALLLAPLATGLALGSELDFIAYLASRFYPGPRYSRVFGNLFFGFQFGLAFSPIVYAWIHDTAGAYGHAFVFSAVALAASVALFSALPSAQPLTARR